METTVGSLDTGSGLEGNFGRVRRLEKAEWWTWGGATAILLLLWMVLAALASEIAPRVEPVSRVDLEIAVHALLGLILLFSLHALYRQVQAPRPRH